MYEAVLNAKSNTEKLIYKSPKWSGYTHLQLYPLMLEIEYKDIGVGVYETG